MGAFPEARAQEGDFGTRQSLGSKTPRDLQDETTKGNQLRGMILSGLADTKQSRQPAPDKIDLF